MGFEGEWKNELGSLMRLRDDGNGSLSGTYHTAVGNAADQYALTGSYDPDASEGSQSLAFSVSWHNETGNSHSATAWAGQLQRDELGDVIVTTWLLTRETQSKDDWESTLVGQDVFRRADVEWAPAKRGPSHGAKQAIKG